MYAAAEENKHDTPERPPLVQFARCTCASTDILHVDRPGRHFDEAIDSKTYEEMLPAIAPATTATRPSKAFTRDREIFEAFVHVARQPYGSTMAVSAIPAVYNVARPSSGGLAANRPCVLGNEYQRLEIEFVRRRLMHRSCLLILVLLLIQCLFLVSPPQRTHKLCSSSGGGPAIAPRLQTTTIAAQRAQILLLSLASQEAAVTRASQKVDDTRARFAETQSNRTN